MLLSRGTQQRDRCMGRVPCRSHLTFTRCEVTCQIRWTTSVDTEYIRLHYFSSVHFNFCDKDVAKLLLPSLLSALNCIACVRGLFPFCFCLCLFPRCHDVYIPVSLAFSVFTVAIHLFVYRMPRLTNLYMTPT